MMNLMKTIKISDVPNLLTLFRVFSIPIIIICIVFQNYFLNWVALILYGLACITDFFDGYLARKYNLETKFGKFFDPIADKILITSIIFILVAVDKINGFFIYPALVIILREILVSGLREFLAKTSPHIKVTYLSKIKTLIQMFSLAFIIIGDDFKLIKYTTIFGEIGLTIASIITIYTGYKYFEKNLKSF